MFCSSTWKSVSFSSTTRLTGSRGEFRDQVLSSTVCVHGGVIGPLLVWQQEYGKQMTCASNLQPQIANRVSGMQEFMCEETMGGFPELTHRSSWNWLTGWARVSLGLMRDQKQKKDEYSKMSWLLERGRTKEKSVTSVGQNQFQNQMKISKWNTRKLILLLFYATLWRPDPSVHPWMGIWMMDGQIHLSVINMVQVGTLAFWH